MLQVLGYFSAVRISQKFLLVGMSTCLWPILHTDVLTPQSYSKNSSGGVLYLDSSASVGCAPLTTAAFNLVTLTGYLTNITNSSRKCKQVLGSSPIIRSEWVAPYEALLTSDPTARLEF